jgi:hypothetical protein
MEFFTEKFVDFESLKLNGVDIKDLFYDQQWGNYFDMLNGFVYYDIVRNFWNKAYVFDTIRSWANAEFNKRKTLRKCDIASAIANTDVFDFLIDIAPNEDTMEHDIFKDIPRRDYVPTRNVNFPAYCYVPGPMQPQHVPMQPQYAAGPSYGPPPPGMLMGQVLHQAYYHNMQLPHPFANPMFPIPKQENDDSTNLPDSEN